MDGFKNNPKLDNFEVLVSCEGNEVIIDKMNPLTDEIFLR